MAAEVFHLVDPGMLTEFGHWLAHWSADHLSEVKHGRKAGDWVKNAAKAAAEKFMFHGLEEALASLA